ncbi:tRNA dihydrouridine(20/20a) synthase DusA [Jiella sp. MQZ9-1]|uniref:tRNA-dihydrouridine(20/20a) synthase n=1 Tax=Jiella flava TaxID=2816857 RepID=A0A939FXI6_9HYPH|nr:tRNA dihydrouridine(20/20a) synthase DusA [Jiella flava]MBO0663818.1 tRNA dihydrouridine(20/20a) synthase DusA [Jiella flava]MCD2472391.1 tRNA dihydrouridine(20/20a) synthase DusA [Jiella flava]
MRMSDCGEEMDISRRINSAEPASRGSDYAVSSRFAVAPMIDWTDRHCRFFHRQLSRRAKLYTEMIVDEAVLHGDVERLLGFDTAEHPVALQLGGSDPEKLFRATRMALDFGYDEINLNVGCPSDRVQSGTFGACLMRDPALVSACLTAMVEAAGSVPVPVPVTVKCRLGVNEQDTETALDALADGAVAAGVAGIWVHARKAWLQGLSPRENREIPPLDYARVHRLKARLGTMFVGLNGGLKTLEAARAEMPAVDGVMLGRAAYQTPDVLIGVDAAFSGDGGEAQAAFDYAALIEAMVGYAARHVAGGGKLNHVTRHMTGLFSGLPGARRWRQTLSEGATRPGATPDLIRDAFAAVRLEAAEKAA